MFVSMVGFLPVLLLLKKSGETADNLFNNQAPKPNSIEPRIMENKKNSVADRLREMSKPLNDSTWQDRILNYDIKCIKLLEKLYQTAKIIR
jgi:hypothetical protein